MESTLGSWNTDNAAGRRDWAKVRLGAEPPSALVEQAALASREILAACGVSPALFDANPRPAAARPGGSSYSAWSLPSAGLLSTSCRPSCTRTLP